MQISELWNILHSIFSNPLISWSTSKMIRISRASQHARSLLCGSLWSASCHRSPAELTNLQSVSTMDPDRRRPGHDTSSLTISVSVSVSARFSPEWCENCVRIWDVGWQGIKVQQSWIDDGIAESHRHHMKDD